MLVSAAQLLYKAKHRSWNTLRHYEHKLRIWSNWIAQEFGVSDLAQITLLALLWPLSRS